MIGAMFLAPVSAVHATTVDFTDEAWIGVNNDTSYSAIGTGITLSSNGIDMTFNGGGDAQGCASASGTTGLVCDGDGIGIGNDEITEGGHQILTVTFDNGPVNVHAIHLLDLFSPATESTGEIAVIKWNSGLNEYEAHAIVGPFNGGGYWEVNEGLSVYPYSDSLPDGVVMRRQRQHPFGPPGSAVQGISADGGIWRQSVSPESHG